MATFYIESGTGKQISDPTQLNPNTNYIESGTGKQGLGSTFYTAPVPSGSSQSVQQPNGTYTLSAPATSQTAWEQSQQSSVLPATAPNAPAAQPTNQPITSVGQLASAGKTYDGYSMYDIPEGYNLPGTFTIGGVAYTVNGGKILQAPQYSNPSQYGFQDISAYAPKSATPPAAAQNTGQPTQPSPATPQTQNTASSQNPAATLYNNPAQNTSQPSTVAPPTLNLQPGDTGTNVKQLQDWLVSQGYMTTAQVATGPGIYGPQTTAAVAKWQTDHGVDNSTGPGYFGPRTIAAAQTQGGTQSSGTSSGSSNTSQQDTGTAATQDQPQTPDGFLATYQSVIKELGLTDIKSQFDDVTKQYADLQNELNDKIADINEDPWVSEGERQKKIANLKDRYDGKLSILTNQQQIYDSLYKTGVAQAQFLTNGIEADQQQQFENAMKLNDAAAKLTEIDPATYKEVQGGLYNIQTGQWVIPPKADTGGNALTTAQMNATINQIVGSFDNEPIVKNFNVLNEGYQFAKSLSNDTKNPGDDQGLIYAFAKAMDPGSVVREGEYATVQKYAQSLAAQYGSSVNQALAGTGFLTPTARENIKKTIESKYEASKANYDNVYNQYQQRIQQTTSGGFNSLTDYSQAFGGGNTGTTYTPGTTVTNNHILYLVGADGETVTPIGSAL